MGAGEHRRPAKLQGNAPGRRPAPDRGGRRAAARDDAVDQAERAGRQEQELAYPGSPALAATRAQRQRRAEQPPSGPRVLHVAAELFPWVKTGGLGDVTAALPPALAGVGVDARVVLPGFSALLDAF